MDAWLLIPMALPVAGGGVLLASSFRERASGAGKESSAGPGLCAYVGIVLGVSVILALAAAWTGERELVLFTLVDGIPVYFRVDDVGRLFVTVVSAVWLLAALFAFVYMGREGKEKRFFGFYLILYGILVASDFAGNLVTMYLFYELATLASMPLVLHSGRRESVMAALKYLFYSLCGAYGGLFAVFVLHRYSGSLTFAPGGTLGTAARGHEGILLIAVFAALLGFGAKAGIVPLHAWLPTAHPVAPSPASAVLSAVIVKSGVLAVIRVVFYIVGPEFLRGTWVQQAWMGLALLTVFTGSMLACRERNFKKRLAYSTVSQVSYILFGLSLLTPEAFAGALLHVAVHAAAKCGLFLTAGVFLYSFGYTKAQELAGIGRRMPVTMWCYLLLALTLVGIPPTGGFVSKWHLAQGALDSDAGIFSWLGPAVLLVSALLTAGYLLPVAMRGFFPGAGGEEDGALPEAGVEEAGGPPGMGGEEAGVLPGAGGEEDSVLPGAGGEEAGAPSDAGGEEAGGPPEAGVEENGALPEAGGPREPAPAMLVPLGILAAVAVLLGIFPGPLTEYVSGIAASVLYR